MRRGVFFQKLFAKDVRKNLCGCELQNGLNLWNKFLQMSYFDLFAEEILRIWAKLCKQRGNFLPVQIFPQKVFRSVLIRAESGQESGQKVRKQLLEQKLSVHSLSYRVVSYGYHYHQPF